MVDKQIRSAFHRLRKDINREEKFILKADIKADRERVRLKRKLQKT